MSFIYKYRNRYILILIFVLIGNILLAQNRALRFNHLSIESGLPDNKVSNVYMDNDDFVWIITSMGITRYDGYRLKIFTPKEIFMQSRP